MKKIDYATVPRLLCSGASHPYLYMKERDDAFPIPREWLKANAQSFNFTDEELRAAKSTDMEAVPNCSGIYFLFWKEEIIYVGLSKGLYARLCSHTKSGRRWTAHAWFEAPPMHLAAIESYYINRIMPEQNCDIPYSQEFSAIIGFEHGKVERKWQVIDALPTKGWRSPGLRE